MKKIFHANTLMLWVIASVLVFTVWLVFGILQVFQIDKSLTILSHPQDVVVLHSKNDDPKKINMSFISRENNLGIIAVELPVRNAQATTTTFRLKEEGSKKWYYVKKYDTKLIAGEAVFPFGFPTINGSKDKSYNVELEVNTGKFVETYVFDYQNAQVFVRYQFSKEKLLSNKALLTQFFIKKVSYASWYLDVFPVLLFLEFFIILFFVFKKSGIKMFSNLRKFKFNSINSVKKIAFILGLGLFLRLILATGQYNFDVSQWILIGQVMRDHVDIYSYSNYYNYSPTWFFILGILDRIFLIVRIIPSSFIIRAFLSMVDVATFFIIYKIAKTRKLQPIKTATLFYLNPVSIIISGHHGQFDNIAILLFLIGLYYSEKSKVAGRVKSRLVFTFLTAALIMKHVIIFQLLYFFINFKKNRLKGLIFFGLSCGILLLTLLPFLPSSGGQIIKRVFLYGGVQGLYGFSYFLGNIFTGMTFFGLNIQDIYKFIFLGFYIIFVLFLRSKDFIRGILLTILFFLTFTSGIGAQYFVLPIAFGALFPTKWFYLYTIAVGLFYLGSVDELNIYTFKVFEWNTVWLFTILWFFSELLMVINPLRKIYRKVIYG